MSGPESESDRVQTIVYVEDNPTNIRLMESVTRQMPGVIYVLRRMPNPGWL